jgi:hypothetical protein
MGHKACLNFGKKKISWFTENCLLYLCVGDVGDNVGTQVFFLLPVQLNVFGG